MSTGRWTELSEEYEVRYTGNGRSSVTAMSNMPGVVERYGLVVELSGPKMTWFQPSPISICSADGPAR
jgi:hypothetical protein